MQPPSLIDLEETPPPPYAPHNSSLTDSFSTTITLPVRPSLRGGYIRPNLSPGEPDFAAASSAALYFEERPCIVQYPSYILEHQITLPSGTTRESLKFPHPEQKFQERDVSVADWNTFVNYLILDQPESLAEKEEDSDDRYERIEAVVVEWNEGFFGPRGVHIHYDLVPAEAPAYTPGDGVSVHPELKSTPAIAVPFNSASPDYQEVGAKPQETGRRRHHHCGPHSHHHRRSSVSSTTSTSSSSSFSSCSIDSFSSGDLVGSNFSEIFRTLSSLRQDPTRKSNLKGSIRQILNEVRAQHRAIPRNERKQWSREFKTELHAHKKEIKMEVKSLFKEAKAAHKVERKARKAEKKAERACSRAQRACSRVERRERGRSCRNHRRGESTVEIEKGMAAQTIEVKAVT